MKKEIKNYTGKSSHPGFIGLDSIVEFEYEGHRFNCKLGGEMIIYSYESKNPIHLHLDFHDEIFNQMDKFIEVIEKNGGFKDNKGLKE